MQLLYSGADKADGIQTDPNKSLGGFVSATPIPNGKINNIFPPISRQMVRDNLQSTRLIVLKNDAAVKTGLKIWTIKGALATYEIAAVAAAIDTKGNPVFEIIYDSSSIPYQATLAEHEAEINALVIGSIVANAVIGIWIKRTLNLSAFTQLDGAAIDPDITCDELETLLIADTVNPIDNSNLFIKWD